MNVYMRELATELGRRQVHIDIFTRWTNPHLPQIVQLTPFVRVIHILAGPQKTVHKNSLLSFIPAFADGIDDFAHAQAQSYDVLHSHYWLSGAAAMLLAERWQTPHVTMFHTLARLKQLAHPSEPETQQRLDMEQRIIQTVDRIVAATREEATHISHLYDVSCSTIATIPCGVDLDLFVPYGRDEARAQLGLDSQRPLLLFAGRLDPFKGPEVLLHAAALMRRDAQVVIVGGEPELGMDNDVRRLEKLATELHIRERVRFFGAQRQQVLPLFYSAADVTVMPSYHETFGLVAVESLACGTPVVATRAGGLMTVVRDGETGFLERRDSHHFAARLDELLCDDAQIARMRSAARRSVLRYSWQHVASETERIYDELVHADCHTVVREPC
jgi:D-inositol-3-phosphate glycosyltransferase